MKIIKPETINFCGSNSRCCMTSQRFMTEPIKERDCGCHTYQKKAGGKSFKMQILEKFKCYRHTPEEFTEDYLMEMRASQPVPDKEEEEDVKKQSQKTD